MSWIAIDAHGSILKYNRTAQILFGYDAGADQSALKYNEVFAPEGRGLRLA